MSEPTRRHDGGGGRIAARWVVLEPGVAVRDHEIAWDRRGRVIALRRARGRVADLCVLPGMVDAHAHLQIAPLPGGSRSFLPWLGEVMATRAGASLAAQRRLARTSLRQLAAEGTAAIGEIDSTGESPAAWRGSPVGGRCYRELTGFHLAGAAARRLVRERHVRWPGGPSRGLSPHAPYSVSADLFRAAAAACRHLAVHCAEVPEEQQFLRDGRGPFADLLHRLGRLPDDFRAPGLAAVRWLERLGLLRASTQLVHCQELERGDVARIAAAGASIVVCPGTIAWFGRTPPPVPRWLAAGIPVALGTDSRASSASYSLRAELAAAAALWPGLSPWQWLEMATSAGGRALGLPGFGRLRRGGRADLIAITAGTDAVLPIVERFVLGAAPARVVVVGGRRIARAPHADR